LNQFNRTAAISAIKLGDERDLDVNARF